MKVTIASLKGITEELAAALKQRGILNSEQLLGVTKTPGSRTELAKAMGVKAAAVLELANRADLARVKGIGRVFSDLLEQAGVDTVKELAQRVPEHLHEQLVKVNEANNISGRTPALSAVQDWVAQAKALPRLLEY